MFSSFEIVMLHGLSIIVEWVFSISIKWFTRPVKSEMTNTKTTRIRWLEIAIDVN